ncbi:hypothetical protein DBR23_08370 [Acidovorax sp. HMWF018]|uniref:hypothetical protein n=1 Tax=Acidovorax sp. HMWF018 TaxID=2056855 RepID=UPI000D36796B|nr:hypothetical protein [Acidovorax sp. HMWF018]PTT40406.1 hypothetical protein DBR23_08370 [Acidovorax sp. HMWF018]
MPISSVSPQAQVLETQQAAVATDAELSDGTVADLLEQVDLQALIADKTLSIHKRSKLSIDQPEFLLYIQIFDLAHVYITAEAKAALSRCYLTPAFLLDKFGAQYSETILSTCTRGKLKGATYLNAQANTYRHVTDNDQEIVVTGTCGKREGKITREVHITCSPRVAQPALAVSHEATPSL